MIQKTILDGIRGNGSLQAEIRIPPQNELKLRPNVIFNIAYNKKILHLGCTDHLSLIDNKIQNGVFIHQQLSRVASTCLGIDINTETTEYLRKLNIENIITATLRNRA